MLHWSGYIVCWRWVQLCHKDSSAHYMVVFILVSLNGRRGLSVLLDKIRLYWISPPLFNYCFSYWHITKSTNVAIQKLKLNNTVHIQPKTKQSVKLLDRYITLRTSLQITEHMLWQDNNVLGMEVSVHDGYNSTVLSIIWWCLFRFRCMVGMG